MALRRGPRSEQRFFEEALAGAWRAKSPELKKPPPAQPKIRGNLGWRHLVFTERRRLNRKPAVGLIYAYPYLHRRLTVGPRVVVRFLG